MNCNCQVVSTGQLNEVQEVEVVLDTGKKFPFSESCQNTLKWSLPPSFSKKKKMDINDDSRDERSSLRSDESTNSSDFRIECGKFFNQQVSRSSTLSDEDQWESLRSSSSESDSESYDEWIRFIIESTNDSSTASDNTGGYTLESSSSSDDDGLSSELRAIEQLETELHLELQRATSLSTIQEEHPISASMSKMLLLDDAFEIEAPDYDDTKQAVEVSLCPYINSAKSQFVSNDYAPAEDDCAVGCDENECRSDAKDDEFCCHRQFGIEQEVGFGPISSKDAREATLNDKQNYSRSMSTDLSGMEFTESIGNENCPFHSFAISVSRQLSWHPFLSLVWNVALADSSDGDANAISSETRGQYWQSALYSAGRVIVQFHEFHSTDKFKVSRSIWDRSPYQIENRVAPNSSSDAAASNQVSFLAEKEPRSSARGTISGKEYLEVNSDNFSAGKNGKSIIAETADLNCMHSSSKPKERKSSSNSRSGTNKYQRLLQEYSVRNQETLQTSSPREDSTLQQLYGTARQWSEGVIRNVKDTPLASPRPDCCCSFDISLRTDRIECSLHEIKAGFRAIINSGTSKKSSPDSSLVSVQPVNFVSYEYKLLKVVGGNALSAYYMSRFASEASSLNRDAFHDILDINPQSPAEACLNTLTWNRSLSDFVGVLERHRRELRVSPSCYWQAALVNARRANWRMNGGNRVLETKNSQQRVEEQVAESSNEGNESTLLHTATAPIYGSSEKQGNGRNIVPTMSATDQPTKFTRGCRDKKSLFHIKEWGSKQRAKPDLRSLDELGEQTEKRELLKLLSSNVRLPSKAVNDQSYDLSTATLSELKQQENELSALLNAVRKQKQLVARTYRFTIGIVGPAGIRNFLARILKKYARVVMLASSDSQDAADMPEENISWFFRERPDVIVMAVSTRSLAAVLTNLLPHIGPEIERRKQNGKDEGLLFVDLVPVKQYARSVMLDCLPRACDILCANPLGGRNGAEGLCMDGSDFVFEIVRMNEVTLDRSHQSSVWRKHCASQQEAKKNSYCQDRLQWFLSIWEKEGCRVLPMSCSAQDSQIVNSHLLSYQVGSILDLSESPAATPAFNHVQKMCRASSVHNSFAILQDHYTFNFEATSEAFATFYDCLDSVRKDLSQKT